jgi:hypothetical protein
MEIEKYRKIIQSIIEKHSECNADNWEVETQIAFDLKRDRYLMFHVGWSGERRVFGCVIHIEIKEGKIWIQRDGIEAGIARLILILWVSFIEDEMAVVVTRSPFPNLLYQTP